MNPYVGHTEERRPELLAVAGAKSIDEIFDQIPAPLRFHGDLNIPAALDEHALMRLALERAGANLPGAGPRAFLGAGIYDHFRPSVVNHLAGRSEFITSYTPYQPEASQGMLQAIFEYQTMVCELTAMDISNASLYDGSTALAEAALVAWGAAKKRDKFVAAPGLHPQWREVLESYFQNLPCELAMAPEREGRVDWANIGGALDESVCALIVQHPNAFGGLEDLEAARKAADAVGAFLIVAFDPVSVGLLKPPGAYGADLAVAEGQGLGLAPYLGGDSLGIFACSEKFMRKAPGRLVGEACDRHGLKGYVLALQTREQHIRREKATSNICTNQGLNALKAAIFMSTVGPQGLLEMAERSCRNLHRMIEGMKAEAGAELAFEGPYFKEAPLRFGVDAKALHARLMEEGYMAGLPLGQWREDLSDALLLCATETKTDEDIDNFVKATARAANAMKRKMAPVG